MKVDDDSSARNDILIKEYLDVMIIEAEMQLLNEVFALSAHTDSHLSDVMINHSGKHTG